ncbi:ParB N-terminal domain-containing protein [Rhizobium leguminosarum]|uniref:ParB N-terminal domain-containing protein n=1 Tax=Rhizobium leguminosarum TaxID=384 RepID=A0A6P0DSG2_RHILE|nr:ParB N-terminal domain-containing protein [Rhizobium leguminosarum]
MPLSKLVASTKNVRKRNAAMTIPELAASIEAHDLIQNLTIRKTARGNKYEVVADPRSCPQGPQSGSRDVGRKGALVGKTWLPGPLRFPSKTTIPMKIRHRRGVRLSG